MKSVLGGCCGWEMSLIFLRVFVEHLHSFMQHADVLSECMCVECVCVYGLWHPVSSLPSKEPREKVHAAPPWHAGRRRGEEKDEREAEDISFVLDLAHNPPLLLHYRRGECPEDARRYDTAATLWITHTHTHTHTHTPCRYGPVAML